MPLPLRTVIDPPAGPRGGRAPVWLPWLVAPAFLLLPIGGCGAAAALLRPRPAIADSPAMLPVPGPVAPVATIVTVAQPAR
jgi:hypothetical protein